MNTDAETNLRWAFALVDGLASHGVRHAVISPGSRSTPLVLACQQHPELRSYVQVDERSAAFFALGLAKQARRPTLLIATSGSAPTHWYPAVVEASQGQTPLVLLSADRPPELQDWGANQTIDQTRLFGSHVRGFYDPGPPVEGPESLRFAAALGRKAVHQSLWPRPGPVHINLPLREPLVPAAPLALVPSRAGGRPPPTPRLTPDQTQLRKAARQMSGRPGLIVCGPMPGADAPSAELTTLAAALECPVLADPLSGLRFGAQDRQRLLARYDAFLRHPEPAVDLAPDWVLRFGAMPISKQLLQFLDRHKHSRHILVAPHGDWPDPLHRSTEILRANPAALCAGLLELGLDAAPQSWLKPWLGWERHTAALEQTGDPSDLPCEYVVIRELIRQLPAGAVLFSGNSLPIRQLDTWSGTGAKPLRILANRGSSGIDGNLSTLLGLAAAGARPVAGLIGDLALFHDLNGLLLARELHAVLVVLNNGGGAIFGYLPQAGLAGYRSHWLTPTGLDPAHMAMLFGLAFQRVQQQGELTPALAAALAAPGVTLIEVQIDPELSQRRHQAYWDTLAGGSGLARVP